MTLLLPQSLRATAGGRVSFTTCTLLVCISGLSIEKRVKKRTEAKTSASANILYRLPNGPRSFSFSFFFPGSVQHFAFLKSGMSCCQGIKVPTKEKERKVKNSHETRVWRVFLLTDGVFFCFFKIKFSLDTCAAFVSSYLFWCLLAQLLYGSFASVA